MTIDPARRTAELETMRSRILGAAHDLVEADVSDAEISSSAGDQHLADHASDVLAREVDDTLEDNAEDIVAEIDAALERIAAGSYGTCARCGATIPLVPHVWRVHDGIDRARVACAVFPQGSLPPSGPLVRAFFSLSSRARITTRTAAVRARRCRFAPGG